MLRCCKLSCCFLKVSEIIWRRKELSHLSVCTICWGRLRCNSAFRYSFVCCAFTYLLLSPCGDIWRLRRLRIGNIKAVPILFLFRVIVPFCRGRVFFLAFFELVKHHKLDFRVLFDLVITALRNFFKSMPILLSFIKSQRISSVAAASFV